MYKPYDNPYEGIIISGIVSASVADEWVLIGLESVGAGAVFYVASFEMLPEAFQGESWKMTKYVLTLFGIAIIAILQIFHEDHDHDSINCGEGH